MLGAILERINRSLLTNQLQSSIKGLYLQVIFPEQDGNAQTYDLGNLVVSTTKIASTTSKKNAATTGEDDTPRPKKPRTEETIASKKARFEKSDLPLTKNVGEKISERA